MSGSRLQNGEPECPGCAYDNEVRTTDEIFAKQYEEGARQRQALMSALKKLFSFGRTQND